MNFLTAIKHAAIGYGIRRKGWEDEDAILYLDNFNELVWVHSGVTCTLIGDPEDFDLTVEDIKAKDWETI
jgi:hypothetical protein